MRSGKALFSRFPSPKRGRRKRGERTRIGGGSETTKGTERVASLPRKVLFLFPPFFSSVLLAFFPKEKSKERGFPPFPSLPLLAGPGPRRGVSKFAARGKGALRRRRIERREGFWAASSTFLPREGKKRVGEKKVGKGKRRFSLFLLVSLLPSRGFSLFSLSLKKREKRAGTRFLAFRIVCRSFLKRTGAERFPPLPRFDARRVPSLRRRLRRDGGRKEKGPTLERACSR